MMHDLMRQSCTQPCPIVFFLFNFGMWFTLNSQVFFLSSIFTSSAASCIALVPRWWWSSCRTCQAFLKITFGGRRGDEWAFWDRISSVLVRTFFQDSRLIQSNEGWKHGIEFARMLIFCLEHFSNWSNILRSGPLSIWFCKVPLVVVSRHKVYPLVARS